MPEEDQSSAGIPPSTETSSSQPGAGLRWLLLALHLAVLSLAFVSMPSDHGFQFGYYFGTIFLISTVVLWTMLYFARSTRNLLAFCLLALVQGGLIAALGLHYQAENRVLREVVADSDRQKQAWAGKMAPFSMDPLYQMLSGEEPWTLDKLKEMNAHAKGGQETLLELQVAMNGWEEQAISRISKTSSQAASDFRKGLESRKSEEDGVMKTLQALLSQDEQLTGFLIQQQGHYQVNKGVLEFDSAQDAESFNEHVGNITQLRQKLDALVQKEQEITDQYKPTH
jgi:hypothetical protein